MGGGGGGTATAARKLWWRWGRNWTDAAPVPPVRPLTACVACPPRIPTPFIIPRPNPDLCSLSQPRPPPRLNKKRTSQFSISPSSSSSLRPAAPFNPLLRCPPSAGEREGPDQTRREEEISSDHNSIPSFLTASSCPSPVHHHQSLSPLPPAPRWPSLRGAPIIVSTPFLLPPSFPSCPAARIAAGPPATPAPPPAPPNALPHPSTGMRCLPFFNGDTKEDRPATNSASVRSFSTTSTERDVRSGSDLINISDMSAESIRRTQYPSFTDRPSNLRLFTFSELKSATRNFSRSLMVGEGGFGCVYRGVIKDSDEPNERIEIAVKQLNRKGLQGQKEWLTEMNVLGIVDHPNLVKLIGYCADDDERGMQRLLVYEYMPNGSVDDHLASRSNSTLSWPMRLKVALDAARGLKYLHEEMDFQVIFRDLKTSNILLDENWNAKLSDFGLARHGPQEGLSHVSTAVVGTLGYAAPEYLQTGRLTAKSDIWGYGVLLYELITGRRPIDRNRPKGEQKLLDWVKPYISDVKRFPIIVDPRLEGHYNLKSMTKLAGVANRCLLRLPKSRPKMSEVYEMVQKIVDSVESGPPQPPLHYHGSVSEPGAKRTKKGSLKRRFHEFKFGSRLIVWRGWKPEVIKTC